MNPTLEALDRALQTLKDERSRSLQETHDLYPVGLERGNGYRQALQFAMDSIQDIIDDYRS